MTTHHDPLRLAFVSGHDPLNVRAFSGTVYYMAKALQAHYPDIELVRFSRPRWYDRFKRLILRRTCGRINPDYWPWLNALFTRRLAQRWRGQRVLVISVASADLVSELAEYVPVLNVTDATFNLMRDFYLEFARYDRWTARAADQMERRSIHLAVHNSFPTNWAATSAIHDYQASPEDVSVISWGCNLPYIPRSEIRPLAHTSLECSLLFLGVDWIRKGGDVVCAAAEILASRGVPTRIDVVGSSPPAGLRHHPLVHQHGFLNKSNPFEQKQLTDLMRKADFLFLPTRQDTFGMVFGEANAYGTPALTRTVGGVGEAVLQGVNGVVLPEDAQPLDFANEAERLWRDPERYRRLRESSRQEYEGRLNWNTWAERITGVVQQLEADGRI